MPPTGTLSCSLRASHVRSLRGSGLASTFDKSLRRTFFGSAASTAPLTLHATRKLPYAVEPLFDLISDVSSYPTFIPFCTDATVHSHSDPDPVTGRKWPATATLRVGFSSFSESYLSQVYCRPFSVVEAVSGPNASSSIPAADLTHYHNLTSRGNNEDTSDSSNELFSSLRARWSLKPQTGEGGQNASNTPMTEVSLAIEAHWKNPVLAATSNTFAPSVAGKIIEAFERRAKQQLD